MVANPEDRSSRDEASIMTVQCRLKSPPTMELLLGVAKLTIFRNAYLLLALS